MERDAPDRTGSERGDHSASDTLGAINKLASSRGQVMHRRAAEDGLKGPGLGAGAQLWRLYQDVPVSNIQLLTIFRFGLHILLSGLVRMTSPPLCFY